MLVVNLLKRLVAQGMNGTRFLMLRSLPLLLVVQVSHVDPHCKRRKEAQGLEGQANGMALDVPRRVSVDVRGQNGKALADNLRSAPCHGTLREAANIDARPSSQEGNAGEDAHGDETGAKDLDLDARHRHEDDVAND